MKHAREDYNRIQDPAGLIPEDEPVFLLRGQDIFAPKIVMSWARELLQVSKDITDHDKRANLLMMATMAIEHATEMVEWQHTMRSKLPDYNPDAKVAYIPGQRKEPQP